MESETNRSRFRRPFSTRRDSAEVKSEPLEFISETEPPPKNSDASSTTPKDESLQYTSGVVVTGTSGAYRIVEAIKRKDGNLFKPLLSLDDKSTMGNFFVGYQQGIEQRETFRKELDATKILDSIGLDDFITIGSGGGGKKAVQLDQMLRESAITNKPRVNLNVILSEKAGYPNEEPSCVINTLLTLNLLAELDKKYGRVLSMTFISNDRLSLQAGERSSNYRDSNKLLAQSIILERRYAADRGLGLNDLIGWQDDRFSTIGFASSTPRSNPQDNDQVISDLARTAVERTFLTPGSIWVGNGDLLQKRQRARVIAFIPPDVFESLSEIQPSRTLNRVNPTRLPSSQQEEESSGSLAEAVERLSRTEDQKDEEFSTYSELSIERIKGLTNINEIHVFCRVPLDSEAVVKGLECARQALSMMKQDAVSCKPKTSLGRKLRELYLMVYHEPPPSTWNHQPVDVS